MAKWKPGGPGRPPASARKRVGRPRKSAARARKSAAAQSLGRRGGAARTAKQNAARRRNARSAGRPAKVCLFCGKPAKGGHKEMRRDASCGKHGWMYRQRNDPPSITALAIREEIAALEQLLVTLEAEPQAAPKAAEDASVTEPIDSIDPTPRRLDPTTLDWETEPAPDEPKPAEPGAVPF